MSTINPQHNHFGMRRGVFGHAEAVFRTYVEERGVWLFRENGESFEYGTVRFDCNKKFTNISSRRSVVDVVKLHPWQMFDGFDSRNIALGEIGVIVFHKLDGVAA